MSADPTALLLAWSQGDQAALNELIPSSARSWTRRVPFQYPNVAAHDYLGLDLDFLGMSAGRI